MLEHRCKAEWLFIHWLWPGNPPDAGRPRPSSENKTCQTASTRTLQLLFRGFFTEMQFSALLLVIFAVGYCLCITLKPTTEKNNPRGMVLDITCPNCNFFCKSLGLKIENVRFFIRTFYFKCTNFYCIDQYVKD